MQRRHDAWMKKPATTGRRLGIAGLAAIGMMVAAGPAQAALSVTGPVDPVTLFPAWYQDSNGTQLQLCLADPGCPASPALADFTGNCISIDLRCECIAPRF